MQLRARTSPEYISLISLTWEMLIFLALACLEPSRRQLICCFIYKKIWISTNWVVELLSQHIKQIFTSVVQWCLWMTLDISPSQQFIFPTLCWFLLLAHTSTQLTALNPELLCSPGLSSTMHCKAISDSEKVKRYKIPVMQSTGNTSASTLQASIFSQKYTHSMWRKVTCIKVLI